jgi:pimeloyl-ACP methyl ester carboxylesterase
MVDSAPRQPLLLIPGLMCDANMWRHQAAALEPYCSEILVADISAADTVTQLAAQVLQNAPRLFSMAGFSMGGIVALEIWRQASGRVLRMALLDTNARSEIPEKLAPRLEQMERVRQGRLREVVAGDLKPNYLGKARQDDTALQQEIVDMAMSLGPDVFLRQCHALNTRADSTDTLATINCPSLVLCGSEDRLCPDWMHEQMSASIPGSQLRIIEQSGHFSTLETPDEVTAAMKAWLSTPVNPQGLN